MRISKVNIKFLAIGGVLVLLAASLSGLITKSADPFKISSKKASFKSLSAFYNQELKWSDCYSSFKCAMYQVPINYDDVASGNFQIAVMKHEAPSAIGNLVINPGGPGGSGVDYAYSYQDAFTPEIAKNFNLVGFDPRGVGRSAPIKCLTPAQTDQLYSEGSFPETDAQLAQLKADSAAFATECNDQNQYLQFYSTANAARDMDILRSLLGDKKLNYLGKSYGTYLGTLYAQLFPNNVGKFVLDGAVDPTINSMEQSLQQAVGFDSAFKAFADDCLKQSACVFNGDAAAQLEQKLSEIRKNPIEVGSRKLTESLVMYGIAFGLYDSELGWPELRSALKDLFAGNGKALLAMADAYTGRDANGQYATNEAESLIVIACDDFPPSKMDVQATKAAAPLFGKYVVYGDMNCEYLPKANFLTVKNKIELNSQVLVIGTANDPATPYKWAVKLSEILQGAKLISLESDGHTGYNRGNACVNQAVEKYLISGVIPAQNLACSA